MSQESGAKRGEAAWKAHLDAIGARNAETRKRARAEQQSREKDRAGQRLADVEGQAEQLRELNARVAKLRKRSSD